MRGRKILAPIIGLLLVLSASAQAPDSLRGIYRTYPAPEMLDTPAPRGYKPVYISHYGRHGSRYHLKPYIVGRPLDSLRAAQRRGSLTPLGASVLDGIESLYSASDGKWAELTPRGVMEHQAIASRMVSRFPAVFRGKRRIEASASLRPRCIASMEAAVSTIGEAAGRRISLSTNADAATNRLLKNERLLPEAQAWYGPRLDTVLSKTHPWATVLRRLYADYSGDDLSACILIRWIWHCWAQAPCIGPESFDIGTWLTDAECQSMARWFDMNIPLKCLRSDIFQESRVETQRELLCDIVSRADSALMDGKTAATLRYGHDANLVPLMGLMNAEGFDGVFVLKDRPDSRWLGAKMIPMASNVQLIFYRRGRKDPVLVKVLYNEKEIRIAGLTPVAGPYYDWEAMKRFWGLGGPRHELVLKAPAEGLATRLVQHAIDSLSALGGGRVTLSGGRFLSGPVELKSGVDLHIEADAVLLASPRLEDFPDRTEPRHFETAALPRRRNIAFIWADEANDISISGKGVIDGNGIFHVREKTGSAANGWPFERIAPAEKSLPRMVFFAGCRNVSVSDVSMVNQPAGWGYWIHDCDRVRFRNCTILNDVRYPNNDGIHVNCSRDVFISGCHIESGDDAVVIRANSRSLKENKACERVVVTDCKLRSWSSAVRIGWVGDGVMRDCALTRLSIMDSSNGIGCYLPKFQYVESSNDYGRECTVVEDFWCEDISMDEIYGNPVYFAIPAEDSKVSVSSFRDIRFKNVRCRALLFPYISQRADVDVSGIRFTGCTFLQCSPSDFPGDVGRHGYVLRKKSN